LLVVAALFVSTAGCAVIGGGARQYKRIHVVCEGIESPSRIIVKKFIQAEGDLPAEIADARERILNLISLQKEAKAAAEVILSAIQKKATADPFVKFKREFDEVKAKQPRILADTMSLADSLKGAGGASEFWGDELRSLAAGEMPAANRLVESLLYAKNSPELKDAEDLAGIQEKVIERLDEILAPNEKPLTVSLVGLNMPVPEDKIYSNTMEFLRQLEAKELILEVYSESNNNLYVSMVFYKAPHKNVAEFGKDTEYNVLLNHELVRKGYATVNADSIPDEYREAFFSAQERAKIERWGIWRLP
jgi:vacuolar-type H+-ATPase subunit H